MSEKKKQHYIPKLRLRKFAYDLKSEKLWILDKNKHSIRSSSIEDACEENYFYKLPISKMVLNNSFSKKDLKALDDACIRDFGKHIKDLSEKELDDLDYSVEDYFANFIEPNLNQYINKIIDSTFDGNKWVVKHCNFISTEDKRDFSWFLAKEFMRTKYFRDIFTNMMEESYKKILPIVGKFRGLDIKENEINVKYSKEQIRLFHAQSLFNDKECNVYASIFSSDIWVLLENFTDESFCCIDNTLMLSPTHKLPSFYGYGLGTYGMTIYIPISPKLMLVLLDINKFKDEYANRDRCIIEIKQTKSIENINFDLIHSAYKYVIFNSKNAAEKYKKMCDDNPILYEEPQKGHVG